MDKHKGKLGDRELDIMQVLWGSGGSTISEVHKSLRDTGADVAYTTIQTMLNRLELKGFVERKTAENVNRYRPIVKESKVVRNTINRLKDRFFKDSTEELIVHLVAQDLNEKQLIRIQKFIDEQRRKEAAK